MRMLAETVQPSAESTSTTPRRRKLSDQELGERFTKLLDQLSRTTDPAERSLVKEELGRLTYGV